MGACVGITLVKQFTYRGDANEQFSNTYHLTGSVPSSNADWLALATALATYEAKVFGPVSTVKAYGYATDNPDDNSVWQTDWAPGTITGGLVIGSSIPAPGDAAFWVRWKTSRLNEHGKPIYLRKYFHDARTPAGGGDAIFPTQKTNAEAFAVKLTDGSFVPDGRKIRSQLHDETILSSSASSFLTTRTLKRRGKRPGS